MNTQDVAANEVQRGPARFVRRQLGRAAGSTQLGVSHMELAPGATSFPFHWHGVNEEAIYVLAGEGTLRLGDTRHPVREGDYVALPVGPEHAHQMVNTGAQTLVYLCMSTMFPAEIAGYPDSQKLGIIGGSAPGGEQEARFVTRFFRATDVDYWDGELDVVPLSDQIDGES